MSEDLITAISGDMLPFIYQTVPAWFHATGGRPMDFAYSWNILCEGNTSLAADPFGYIECLCLSTPNICSEKNIFRYIVLDLFFIEFSRASPG